MHNLDLSKTVINVANLEEGLTQSELTTWDECAEKWYLGYNHMLAKRGTYAWHFIYGDGVHNTLEHWYKTRGELEVATLQFPDDVFPSAQETDDLRKWQLVLQAQMEAYTNYYRDDFDQYEVLQTEQEFVIEHQGVKLRGKIDLVLRHKASGDIVVPDHKTAGRLTVDGWEFRFQFMFYAWAAQKFLGEPINWFMPNGIKKPALRVGKAESLESYAQRVKADMLNEPDKYYLRVNLPVQEQLAHFEKKILQPKINRVKLLTQPKVSGSIIELLVRNQNTAHCVKFGVNNQCQFFDLCKNGFEKEGFAFTQRPSKHQELDED
jgi:hypothetical protein